MLSQTTINIELGLAALCKHAKYGQTLTQQEIADVCGCTRGGIFMLEKQAMNKLKKKAHRYAIAEYSSLVGVPTLEHGNEMPVVDAGDVLIEMSA